MVLICYIHQVKAVCDRHVHSPWELNRWRYAVPLLLWLNYPTRNKKKLSMGRLQSFLDELRCSVRSKKLWSTVDGFFLWSTISKAKA